jgi:hypothetical protein
LIEIKEPSCQSSKYNDNELNWNGKPAFFGHNLPEIHVLEIDKNVTVKPPPYLIL